MDSPQSPDVITPAEAAKQLQGAAIAVSDWLAEGCDCNDIPRAQIATLVAWTKETTREALSQAAEVKVCDCPWCQAAKIVAGTDMPHFK